VEPEPEYDVVVVGARVAGASLGALVARQGRRVLLLDREAFPSDTLSTHYVHPFSMAILARLGVLDDLLEAGFRKVTRVRSCIEDCAFEAPLPADGGFGLAPRRNVLDSLLQQRAVADGAELRTQTSVEGLVREDDRVVGVVAAGRELRARLVVGADGKTSKVAGWAGAEAYRETPPLRPAYYGYYRGVAPLPEPAVELFFGGDTVGFLFPMRPGEDCLALELQPDDFEAFRGDPQREFEERFRALPGMAARLRDATLEGKLKGTRGVANHVRVPYGPGWALTGDAAYLKDPVTGFGIGDALAQASLLGDALGEWLDGAEWDETMSAYQARRDEQLLPLYEATLEFARMADPATESVDRLRALLGTVGNLRLAAAALPDRLDALLPPDRVAMVEQVAAGFARARTAPAAATTG
jgi:flavin-dependent dehydrogenase